MNIVKVLAAAEMLDRVGLQLDLGPWIGEIPFPPILSDVDLYVLKRGIDALEKMCVGADDYPTRILVMGDLICHLTCVGSQVDLEPFTANAGLNMSTDVYRVMPKRRLSMTPPKTDDRRKLLYDVNRAVGGTEQDISELILKYSRKEREFALDFLETVGAGVSVHDESGADFSVEEYRNLDKTLHGASDDVLYGLYSCGVDLLNLNPRSGTLSLLVDAGPSMGTVGWAMTKNLDRVTIENLKDLPSGTGPVKRLYLQSIVSDDRHEEEDPTDLTDHEKKEWAIRNAVRATLDKGYGLYPFKKGYSTKFEVIDPDEFKGGCLSDLYWLLVGDDIIPNNGKVGTNLPCGITLGLSSYFVLDYCPDRKQAMLSWSTYVGIMETVPEERRLYIGSTAPVENTSLENRILKYTQV